MNFYIPGSIQDDDIRDVYLRDISQQYKFIQNRHGITPLYFGKGADAPDGFHFEDIYPGISEMRWNGR
jgi:hypothetical protein